MPRPDFGTQTGQRAKAKPSLYFTRPGDHDFIPSGCTVLDCVLGGGWVRGRISNVIGDSMVGKTLLCIEACANAAYTDRNALIRFAEAEQAFDEDYAEALGLPLNRVEFYQDFNTVEQFYSDLEAFCKRAKTKGHGGIYVLDSLDALSDAEEMDREIGEGTYGAKKAKQMSALFRKLTMLISQANVLVLIVSQIRDKIGVTFGRKWTVSSGKALQFYCSQRLFLKHTKQITKEVAGIKRTIGVEINAEAIKLKIGMPFRDCDFHIRFGYGIEDFAANLEFLKVSNRLFKINMTEKDVPQYLKMINSLDPTDKQRDAITLREEREIVGNAVREAWSEIETTFLPTYRKYG